MSGKSIQIALMAKKWLYIDKLAHFNGMIMGPHTKFPNQCRYFAIYVMENATCLGPHHCSHRPFISNLLSPAGFPLILQYLAVW